MGMNERCSKLSTCQCIHILIATVNNSEEELLLTLVYRQPILSFQISTLTASFIKCSQLIQPHSIIQTNTHVCMVIHYVS